jgi:hypothetical protein
MSDEPSSPREVPEQLWIAHTAYDVAYSDDECDALGSDGHILIGARRIAIRSTLHADREREVVLHEALHACIGVTRLGLSDDDEETYVDALTGPLLDLIRRNPGLVEFLCGD